MDRLTVMLLKASKANVIALSNDSYQYYKELLGERTFYLKTGVDTKKFVPVDAARKQELRKKYGVDDGKKIVLHVGHLKNGRNVDKLLRIDEKYHVILVVSSVTQQDTELRRKLEERPNVTIIDDYLENIEEIYQLSDVYLFPVQTLDNCIDVPLSVLEAASCGISIVATRYGELREFNANDGFAFIDTLSDAELNKKLDEMSAQQFSDNRSAVQEYDWDSSIKKLIALTSLGE